MQLVWCGRSLWQDGMGQQLLVFGPRLCRSLASHCINSLSLLENSEDCKNIKCTAKNVEDLKKLKQMERTKLKAAMAH
jgi:hypothetical protein